MSEAYGMFRTLREEALRHNWIGNVQWHDGTLTLWIEIFELAH
jgi:hypothetical protein